MEELFRGTVRPPARCSWQRKGGLAAHVPSVGYKPAGKRTSAGRSSCSDRPSASETLLRGSCIVCFVKDFLQDQQEEIMFDGPIAVFIAVEVLRPIARLIGTGEVVEVESPGL